jgi:hypothetical protein
VSLSSSTPVTDQGNPVVEELAARWVIAISMVLIAAFSLIAVLPTPAGLPGYARFLPVDLSPPEQASSEPDLVGNESESTPVPDAPNAATATAAIVPDVPNITVATAMVTVQSANCRARPLGGAERITIFYKNQALEIVGRNEDLTNPWWYVKIPDTDAHCWLWSMTATMTGNIDEIPIVK